MAVPVGGVLRAAVRTAGVVRITLGLAARGRAANGPDAARVRTEGLAAACRAGLHVLGIEVEVRGTPPGDGVLLASNHVSYVDPVAVAAVAPCVPISKSDVLGWPIFGPAAQATGVLFVARGERSSGLEVRRAAEETLRGGLSVLNFAEGTTTVGDRVLPFRRGLFEVALRAGIDVVPVALAYDPPDLAWVGDATFVPHFLRLAARRRARVTVSFGAPLPARLFREPAELADAAHARVTALLEGPTPCRKTQP